MGFEMQPTTYSIGTGPAWDRMMARVAELGAKQGAELRHQRRRDDHRYAKRLRDRVQAKEISIETWLAGFYRPTARDQRIAETVRRYFRRYGWVQDLVREAA